MIDDKWVGKFANMGVDTIPDKPEPVTRIYKGRRGRKVKVDEQRERIERSFADATGRTGRVERALKIWQAGLITHMDEAQDENGNVVEDVWEVGSQTDKGQSYVVFEGTCGCPDKEHNGGQECKHEISVLMFKGEEIDGVKYNL